MFYIKILKGRDVWYYFELVLPWNISERLRQSGARNLIVSGDSVAVSIGCIAV